MKSTMAIVKTKITGHFISALLLVFSATFPFCLYAKPSYIPASLAEAKPTPEDTIVDRPATLSDFRIEKIAVAGGAELITIFGKEGNLGSERPEGGAEIPLLSDWR